MTVEIQHIPIVKRDGKLSKFVRFISAGTFEVETTTQYGVKDEFTGRILTPELFEEQMSAGEAVYVSDLSKTVHNKSRIVKVKRP